MATLITNLPVPDLQRSERSRERRSGLILATVLTPLTVLVHGFHPFAEDGGVYLAGVEKLLHPNLFPSLTSFVVAPTRHSAFAVTVAALARVTHLSSSTQLPALIFGLHLASIWATLVAASALAARCWRSLEARTGAVLLLASWMGLPVAGTSLLFMDPYLTARSISTPCLIAALVGALDATEDPSQSSRAARRRGLLLVVGSLAVAALFHPLMAGYALLASVLVAACRVPGRGRRRAALASIFAASVVIAAATSSFASPDSAAYTAVCLTRAYWFLSLWHWYELVGVAAPAAIVAAYLWFTRNAESSRVRPARALAAAAASCAVLVTSISLLFARTGGASHLVAALQPMRGLHFVYLVMTLLLGATLGGRVLRQNTLAWLVVVPLLALPLYAASRFAAPSTRHVEIPTLDSRNDWVHAFLWIRDHTPSDALFSLPANYVGAPGEDAQCFRAISERSALPDYSKDGGEAAVAPALAPLWVTGEVSQSALETESDQLRRSVLKPLGVSWLVLPVSSATELQCPFQDAAVKVCRLR